MLPKITYLYSQVSFHVIINTILFMLPFSMLAVSFLCSKSPSSPHHSPISKDKKKFETMAKSKTTNEKLKESLLTLWLLCSSCWCKNCVGWRRLLYIYTCTVNISCMCIYARIFIKPQLNLVPNLNPFLCIGSKSYRTRTFAFVFVYIQIN